MDTADRKIPAAIFISTSSENSTRDGACLNILYAARRLNRYVCQRMIPLLGTLACMAVSLCSTIVDARPVASIGIVGDSTVCIYPESSPMRGWGQMLPEFLNAEVVVINEARTGASTKNFEPERWQRILKARPDFVLIQFGHNDSHGVGRPESTDAETDYRDNLRRFIQEARQMQITPILVTPPHRRRFSNGKPTTELAGYVEAMHLVGADNGVAVIDLQAMSGRALESLGEMGSTFFTVNTVSPNGRQDRTHFTVEGARELAQMVATQLPVADKRLEAFVRAEVSLPQPQKE